MNLQTLIEIKHEIDSFIKEKDESTEVERILELQPHLANFENSTARQGYPLFYGLRYKDNIETDILSREIPPEVIRELEKLYDVYFELKSKETGKSPLPFNKRG